MNKFTKTNKYSLYLLIVWSISLFKYQIYKNKQWKIRKNQYQNENQSFLLLFVLNLSLFINNLNKISEDVHSLFIFFQSYAFLFFGTYQKSKRYVSSNSLASFPKTKFRNNICKNWSNYFLSLILLL